MLAQKMPPTQANGLIIEGILRRTVAPKKPTNRSRRSFLRTNLQKGSKHEPLFLFSIPPEAATTHSHDIPERHHESAQGNLGTAGGTPAPDREPVGL
jgi:hypothetical protein